MMKSSKFVESFNPHKSSSTENSGERRRKIDNESIIALMIPSWNTTGERDRVENPFDSIDFIAIKWSKLETVASALA